MIKGFETDAARRVADREKQEAHDKEIQQRLHSGEEGQSGGGDNHVAVIMLGFASLVTVVLLLMIFNWNPR